MSHRIKMHRLFSQPGLTLAHRIAPYRIGTEFLHDYYTVNTSLLKPYLRYDILNWLLTLVN